MGSDGFSSRGTWLIARRELRGHLVPPSLPFYRLQRGKETDLRPQSNQGAEPWWESRPFPTGTGRISKDIPTHLNFRGWVEVPIPLAPNTLLLLLTAKDNSFLGGEDRDSHWQGWLWVVPQTYHLWSRLGWWTPLARWKKWAEQGYMVCPRSKTTVKDRAEVWTQVLLFQVCI